MRVTFLGHQGWQFENGGRSFLLDPILESIGNGAAQMPIWPRRRLDFARFEPIDAVLISHEHADHFSLATLKALPSRCLIYLSDLSSSAMETIIAEMGFQVQRFTALQPFTICGMCITALPGLYNLLEPDAYALLVQDEILHEDRGASFLTSIDTVPHPDVFAWLEANCPVRTLDNLTNNFIESRHLLVGDPTSYTKSREMVAANAVEFSRTFKPRRAIISGQGWSFGGAKSELNHSNFSVDNRWLTLAVRELAPQVEWFEGVPGMCFTLHGEHLSLDQSPLVGELQSPSREFNPDSVQITEPFACWAEINEIGPDRFAKVRDFICQNYGQILGAYAPKLMERLYYLKLQGAGEALSATFAIIIRNGAARVAFELDYGQLVFREFATHASSSFAVGVEIWAADFELIIGAQEDVFTIYESAVRPWSHVPDLIEVSTLIEAFMWFTPRFRPLEFLGAYRSQLAKLKRSHPL